MNRFRNLAEVAQGSYRSLGGAAAEHLAIGRATQVGLFTFFKVWRDQPYDVVIDSNGQLYRVEIKGASTGRLDCTRGGRAGKMIDRAVPSRQRPISRDDCDFLIGVVQSGDEWPSCYIIPAQVLEIIAKARGAEKSLSVTANALAPFHEAWHLFMQDRPLRRDLLRGIPETRSFVRTLDEVEAQLGIEGPVPRSLRIDGMRDPIEGYLHPKIMRIWRAAGWWDPVAMVPGEVEVEA